MLGLEGSFLRVMDKIQKPKYVLGLCEVALESNVTHIKQARTLRSKIGVTLLYTAGIWKMEVQGPR